MIYKICVIEDSPSDYGDIIGTLDRFILTMKSRATIELMGIKVWETELDDLEEEITRLKPNIIVLDHDLKWGTKTPPIFCNGVGVINRLGKLLNPFPYVICTSRHGGELEYLQKMTEITTKNPISRKASTIIEKEYFTELQKQLECFSLLKGVLHDTKIHLPHYKIAAFPYPEGWNTTAELRPAHQKDSLEIMSFSLEHILAIIVEGNNQALFHIETQESEQCIKTYILKGHSLRDNDPKYGINDLVTDLRDSYITSKFVNSNKGILYNSQYMTLKDNKTVLKTDPSKVAEYKENLLFNEDIWDAFISKLLSYNDYTHTVCRDPENPQADNFFYNKIRFFIG